MKNRNIRLLSLLVVLLLVVIVIPWQQRIRIMSNRITNTTLNPLSVERSIYTRNKNNVIGISSKLDKYLDKIILDLEATKSKVVSNSTANHPVCNSTVSRILKASHSEYLTFVTSSLPGTETMRIDFIDTGIMDEINDELYLPVSNNCTMLEFESIDKPINKTGCKSSVDVKSVTMEWNNRGNVLPFNIGKEEEITSTYLHVIPNATIQPDGDVISGGVKLIPRRCKQRTNRYCIKTNASSTYDEVFTISQYWGNGFFHGTLENLPRLALYLPYLRKHENIKIHVASTHPFLPYLGLSPDRLVVGTVQAKVLYMPAGGVCGKLPYIHGRMLALELQRPIRVNTNRDVIVLIRRSHHRRWFNNHGRILAMLRKYGKNYGLEVIEFRDDPVPPVHVTMEIFHRALIVIAPHGAGASNMIFSKPGTVLIEGLCHEPELNLCYQHMSLVLGLRYYGLTFSKSCMDITPDEIEKPLVEYLTLYGYIA